MILMPGNTTAITDTFQMIRNVTVNDISRILKTAEIREIFLNGKKAYQYYQKYMQKSAGYEGICLPSTSPANAAWNIDKLTDSWKLIKL